MRAAAILLACAFGGCTFHVDGIGSDTTDFAAFLFDGGNTLPFDLARAPTPDLAPPPSLLDLTPPPPDLSGAFLHVTSAPTTAMVDLSQEGTIDWAHWGWSIASDFDHKSSGNGLISNYALVNTIGVGQYGDGLVSYKWHDGESGIGQRANSMGPTTTGVYVTGIHNGVHVTVPAENMPRHVRFYVGGYKSVGQVQISLSDGSAPAVEDHSYGSINDHFNVVYDVEYEAGSANQTLLLSWTMMAGDNLGNVTLQSATLLAP
jgi:hypothetical protein